MPLRIILRSLQTSALLLAIWPVLANPLARAQPAAEPAANTALLSTPTKPIEFDVATFKLNKTGSNDRKFDIRVGGDGFIIENRPMHDLIRYAYALRRGGSYLISGQPQWVDDDHYDIQAKVAPEDLAEWKRLDLAGQKIVLRDFVVQYLKLKQHPDPAPHPYYALVVAKGGLKMKEFKPGDVLKTPNGQVFTNTALEWITRNELVGQSVGIERLADQLSGHADRVVINQTGLPGAYNFKLIFDDEPDPNGGPNRPFLALQPSDAAVSIRSAVKQLGLELVPTKGPTEGMVIDHIERPPSD